MFALFLIPVTLMALVRYSGLIDSVVWFVLNCCHAGGASLMPRCFMIQFSCLLCSYMVLMLKRFFETGCLKLSPVSCTCLDSGVSMVLQWRRFFPSSWCDGRGTVIQLSCLRCFQLMLRCRRPFDARLFILACLCSSCLGSFVLNWWLA